MRSSILRPLLALACLFIGWAHAMDLDDLDLQDIKASKVLKMIPAGKPGSCADEPMDRILQDAATLAKNAVEAIETLLESYKIENTDENIKILNMAYISFGVKYDMYGDCNDPALDPKKPMPLVITEGRRRLQTVTYNFQGLLGKLIHNKRRLKMECGDEDLRKVTTLGDLGLRPKEKTIKAYQEEMDPIKKTTDADVVGYYLLKYFSPQVKPGVYDMNTVVLAPWDKPKTFAMNNPCQRIGGFYSDDAYLMMICRRKFSLKSLRQAIKDQAHITERSRMDQALDDEETPSSVFLHEAMHWINPKIDDVFFRPRGSKQEVGAYGSYLCRLLAFDKRRVEDTVINADSYKMFAKGITLNKINWYPKGYEENTGLEA